MKTRWSCLAVCGAILALAALPLFQTSVYQDIALLERLAPRIERAQKLAPEARDAIAHLLDRVSQGVSDARHDARRQIAIDRVTAALAAKGGVPEIHSVGQRQVD